MVKTLLKLRGIDVNAVTEQSEEINQSILTLAVHYEQWDIVKQLIDKGADLNVFHILNPKQRFLPLALSLNKLDLLKNISKPQNGNLEVVESDYANLDRSILEHNSDEILAVIQYLNQHATTYIGIKSPIKEGIAISEQDLDQIYYTQGHKRTTELSATFKEAFGAYKDDISDAHNSRFFTEIAALMDKFTALYKEKAQGVDFNRLNNEQNTFDIFKTTIKNANHFHTDDPKYYEGIKNSLEEIFYILDKSLADEATKSTVLSELFSQLDVCGPGIFNSILLIRAGLAADNIEEYLSRHRDIIVNTKATQVSNELNINPGMIIHTVAAFMLEAKKLGYTSPAAEALSKTHDPYVTGAISDVGAHLITQSIHDAMLDEYDNLDYLIKKITTDFNEELKIIWSGDAIDATNYAEIADRVNSLMYKYGLSMDAKESNPLLIGSDDNYNAVFNFNLLNYAIVKGLVDHKFIETKVYNQSFDRQNMQYFVIGERVFLLHTDKEGNYKNYFDKEALKQILAFELKPKEVSPEVMRAAVLDISKENHPALKKLLSSYEQDINNNKPNIDAKDKLLILATKLAEFYNDTPKHEPVIFNKSLSKDSEVQDPSPLSGEELYKKTKADLKPTGRNLNQ